MKWIGITGSRQTNENVEKDVRFHVSDFMEQGCGLVAGGSWGVDSIALDEALKNDPVAERIKIFLPTSLETYSKHYRKRAAEGAIETEESENLIKQLEDLQKINPESLKENSQNTEVDRKSYFERNGLIVANSDEMIAFQVNDSPGTQDTIEKTNKKRIPIKILKYTI